MLLGVERGEKNNPTQGELIEQAVERLGYYNPAYDPWCEYPHRKSTTDGHFDSSKFDADVELLIKFLNSTFEQNFQGYGYARQACYTIIRICASPLSDCLLNNERERLDKLRKLRETAEDQILLIDQLEDNPHIPMKS